MSWTGKGVKLTSGESDGKNAISETGQKKPTNRNSNANSNYKNLWVDADKTANMKQDNEAKDTEVGIGKEEPTKCNTANNSYKHLWVDVDETANVSTVVFLSNRTLN